jgi:hypothetical protein
MVAQQYAKSGQRSAADHLQRMPQADLIGRQHRLAQIALQRVDDGKGVQLPQASITALASGRSARRPTS